VVLEGITSFIPKVVNGKLVTSDGRVIEKPSLLLEGTKVVAWGEEDYVKGIRLFCSRVCNSEDSLVMLNFGNMQWTSTGAQYIIIRSILGSPVDRSTFIKRFLGKLKSVTSSELHEWLAEEMLLCPLSLVTGK